MFLSIWIDAVPEGWVIFFFGQQLHSITKWQKMQAIIYSSIFIFYTLKMKQFIF